MLLKNKYLVKPFCLIFFQVKKSDECHEWNLNGYYFHVFLLSGFQFKTSLHNFFYVLQCTLAQQKYKSKSTNTIYTHP